MQEKCKFSTNIEGKDAYVSYKVENDKLDILHTFVPVELEGRGIASNLVRAAYDFAIQNELKPKATCTYAMMWLIDHPEYKR